MNLPSPKNYYNKDICVKHRKEQISYTGRYQTTNDLEMMSMNWKYFEFKKQIPVAKQKDKAKGFYMIKLCKTGFTWSNCVNLLETNKEH